MDVHTQALTHTCTNKHTCTHTHTPLCTHRPSITTNLHPRHSPVPPTLYTHFQSVHSPSSSTHREPQRGGDKKGDLESYIYWNGLNDASEKEAHCVWHYMYLPSTQTHPQTHAHPAPIILASSCNWYTHTDARTHILPIAARDYCPYASSTHAHKHTSRECNSRTSMQARPHILEVLVAAWGWQIHVLL